MDTRLPGPPSPQRERRAMPSSVSAPVSPSASYASLEALRNSIAMRSGDLDLDESAHTFPISDEVHGPRASASASSSSPSSPRLSMSSSSTTTATRNGRRKRTSTDRRVRSETTSSSFPASSSSSALPMISPLSPLSMANLPSSSFFSHTGHDRRLSPFHDGRGTGFTPAATPPALDSPRLSPVDAGSWPAPSRSANGSCSGGSGSVSPSAPFRPSSTRSNGGRHSHAGPSTRNRHRSSSDVTGTSITDSRRHSDHSSHGTAASSSSRRRTRNRSHSGASLTSSHGFPESEASDTGDEGDAEGAAVSSRSSNGISRPSRPNRTRSSPHLPLESSSLPTRALGGSHTYDATNGDSPWRSLVFDANGQPAGAAGYFGLSPGGPADDASLWRLHAAALDAAAAANNDISGQPSADVGADLNELLPPPPPYQANEDSPYPQPTASSTPTPTTEAHANGSAVGNDHRRDREDDDALAFETRPRQRGQSDLTPLARSRDGSTTQPHQRATTTASIPTSTQPQDRSVNGNAAGPPAWQPKSDTEGEDTAAEAQSRTSAAARQRRQRLPPTRSEGRSNHHRGRGQATSSSRRAIQVEDEPEDDGDDGFSPWLLRLLLHPLRMLAAVPGFVGTFWLLRNACIHMSRSQGSLLQRSRLLNVADHPSSRPTCGLDFLLASMWALSTAYHALSLTTLLLRRWLIYYSLFPSLIRLIALQAICWPLVRLTIFVAGPDRPVEAWIVIASFTAFSDVVARWVTSNIADAPTQRAPPSGGGGPSSRQSRSAAVAGSSAARTSALHTPTARSRASSRERVAVPAASATTGTSTRPQGRVRAGQRFWRAIMGSAPFDSSTSDEESDEDEGGNNEELLLAAEERQQERNGVLIKTSALDAIGRSGMTNLLLRRLRGMRKAAITTAAAQRNGSAAPGTATEDDSALDGGETTDAGLTTPGMTGLDDDDDDEDLDLGTDLDGSGDVASLLRDGETPSDALRRLRSALSRRRRRRRRMREKVWAVSGWGLTASAAASNRAAAAAAKKGSWHIRSRRVFHWEVAVRRNVAPIGILAYLTLWGLLVAR